MRLKVLADKDISTIDRAARQILNKTGVLVPHEKMVEIFGNAGADVDRANGRVRIPSQLVDECLARAKKSFTIYGRDRSKSAAFGQEQRNYNSAAGEASWLDRQGRRRFACINDVVEACKIAQVLPGLTIAGAMSDPHEIDVNYRCVFVAATQLRTTTKPIAFFFYDGPSARFVVELFLAVAGTKEELAQYPFAYPFLEPISPLRFDTRGIDVLFETCHVPLPVSIGPMAQTGLSAPVTLAGTLAQETAEILAGICIVQLIRPGTPVCFGSIPHAFDMKTTQMIFGGPEQGLMAAAMTGIGKHFGFPVYINVGLTDSKCVDAQAGLEITASLLMGILAGADIFGHLGIAGVDQAASLEMLVFQHEVVEYLERIARSFTIDKEHLALDLIDQVGPGGTFIDQMHTAQYYRQELWIPTLLDRRYWQQWEQAGRPTLAGRLVDRVDELLKEYKEIPLAYEISKDVNHVLDRAKKHLAG